MSWHKRDWLILVGIVAIAAFFRLWRLDVVPTGFQFDEAYNVNDALRVIAGERPIFFEANGGRESLYIYLLAPFVSFLGATPLAPHLLSALVGILTIILSYAFLRRLLPADEWPVAALATALMAISYWHIHFSRYGIRAITLPLMLVCIFYCLWRAFEFPPHSLTFYSSLIAAGFFLGLSIYAHPAARLAPIIIVAWFGWLIATRNSQLAISNIQYPIPNLQPPPPYTKAPLRCLQSLMTHYQLLVALSIIALISFIVFLPLGLYFMQHPEQFIGHPKAVFLTGERIQEDHPVSALVANVARVAGMFFVSGDAEWIHNIPHRPMFDLSIALFFIIGLLVWVKKLWAREPVAVFALLWLLVMLTPTLLSDAAPNFSRAIGIMPLVFIIPAWGLRLAERGLRAVIKHRLNTRHPLLTHRFPVSHIPYLITFYFLLFSLTVFITYHDYFNLFPNLPDNYYFYDSDKVDATQYLLERARTDRIYLPPLWSQHATFALLTRDAGFKSFDNGEIIVLPPPDGQRGMTYAFPSHGDPIYMDYFAETYGALAQRETVNDALGRPLLTLFRIAPQAIPADAALLPATLPIAPRKIVNANFNNEIRLVGYRITPSTSNDKPYQLTLVWQAQKRIAHDYTLFIHLNDANGQRLTQKDRRPGNGSYPTTVWTAGETLVDIYELWSQGAVPTQFVVGWYRSDNKHHIPVVDANGKPTDDKVTFAVKDEG
jgi:hypothetical protein